MRYEIVAEPHYMSPQVWTDKAGQPHVSDGVWFSHAIHRGDGSLVFRAVTLDHAEKLLGRLFDQARILAAMLR